MLSFKELEIPQNCNIVDECIKHMSQAGSVFPLRAEAKERVEIAVDNVKYVQGKIEYETNLLGKIPAPTEEDPDNTIKITVSAMASYVNQHPEVIEARKERAAAYKNYDDILGLVTAFNTKKDLLSLIRSDRVQEFYSKPTVSDDVTGLEEFNKK